MPASDMTQLPRVLLVDDDANVLEGMRRTLRGLFRVETAVGARAAIALLEHDTDFSVIVSDLRMPDLDGVMLLNQVRDGAPDIVRILLTGHANAEAAIRAVNDGAVFRFLTKPCPSDLLRATVAQAADMYRTERAERVLQTLTMQGSVKLLADVIALAQPAAFARAMLVQRYVAEIAGRLAMQERWAVELAAMLSQIGSISLPRTLVARMHAGEPLDEAEQAEVNSLPAVAEQLLAHVPLLDGVRDLLRQLPQRFADRSANAPGAGDNTMLPGSRLLRVALDYVELEARGVAPDVALRRLRGCRGVYDPDVLAAFAVARGVVVDPDEVLDDCSEAGRDAGPVMRELFLADVTVGMQFAEDVIANDLVLVARGQLVTASLVHRIHQQWTTFAESCQVRVWPPAPPAEA